LYGLSEPILPLFSPCKTVNAKFYTPTVKQLPIFPSFFNLKCEANGKQCDFSFFLPFFFIYCISILYGLLVLLFVFPLIFSGLWKLPKAFFSGNWDYCDKLLQWMMPPRIILFGFLVIFSIVTTWYDWSLSLKWWGITFILIISFFMAIPDYLVDNRFQKAIISLPLLFILMFLNLFRLRGANKKFIHTVHGDHSSDNN